MNTRLRSKFASVVASTALAMTLPAPASADDFGGVAEALLTLQGVDPITLLTSAIGQGLLAIAAVALVGIVLGKLVD